MSTTIQRINRRTILILLLLLIMSSTACKIPFLSQETPSGTELPSGQITGTSDSSAQMPPSGTAGLPNTILTEVAGTLYAKITEDASAIASETVTILDGSTTTEPLPTLIATSQMQTQVALGTVIPDLPYATITIPGYTPIAPADGVWITPYFQIRNLNLHECGKNYEANFKVKNRTSKPLESVSLKFFDRTTNTVLTGPTINNAPFLSTDRTCSIHGADTLPSYTTRYVGDLLGPKNLQAHTIRAEITICSGENLSGICSEAALEFVVP
jgi:hypothetical protein